jgi:hypothetical protein
MSTAGLILNPTTGVISGTPTTATAGKTYTFTIKVVNAAGSYISTLKIFSSGLATMPSVGTIGQPYSFKLNVSFTIVALPVIWSIISGSLPTGFNRSAYGIFKGHKETRERKGIVQDKDANERKMLSLSPLATVFERSAACALVMDVCAD